jgi:hypothetical protein
MVQWRIAIRYRSYLRTWHLTQEKAAASTLRVLAEATEQLFLYYHVS